MVENLAQTQEFKEDKSDILKQLSHSWTIEANDEEEAILKAISKITGYTPEELEEEILLKNTI